MGPALGIARSFSGRRWNFRELDEGAARKLATAINISETLARLLTARGVTEADAGDYLNPTLKNLLPEPRLLDIKGSRLLYR